MELEGCPRDRNGARRVSEATKVVQNGAQKVPEATKMEPKGCLRRPKWSQVVTKTSQGDPKGSPCAKVSKKETTRQIQMAPFWRPKHVPGGPGTLTAERRTSQKSTFLTEKVAPRVDLSCLRQIAAPGPRAIGFFRRRCLVLSAGAPRSRVPKSLIFHQFFDQNAQKLSPKRARGDQNGAVRVPKGPKWSWKGARGDQNGPKWRPKGA